MFGLIRKNKNNKNNTTHLTTAENESQVGTQKTNTTAQKRSDFRLDCNIEAVTKTMSKNERSQIILGEPLTTLISNLSSGGAKLLSNTELKKNERILLSFSLDDSFIVLTGEILFSSESLNPDYQHQYGLKFIGASTIDQDIIWKYLLKEQRQSIL